MSVILRDETGQIILLCKGADRYLSSPLFLVQLSSCVTKTSHAYGCAYRICLLHIVDLILCLKKPFFFSP